MIFGGGDLVVFSLSVNCGSAVEHSVIALLFVKQVLSCIFFFSVCIFLVAIVIVDIDDVVDCGSQERNCQMFLSPDSRVQSRPIPPANPSPALSFLRIRGPAKSGQTQNRFDPLAWSQDDSIPSNLFGTEYLPFKPGPDGCGRTGQAVPRRAD